MATYLVTGGAGFIGSNLVSELLTLGHDVRILDNFSTGREVNLRAFEGRVTLIRGDIRDAAIVDTAVKGVDYVLHQAALASVPRSIANPIASSEVNIQGTLNLLQAAHQHKVKRFVAASSSSVYGDSVQLPKVEAMPTNPKSPYAVTKLTLELYLRVFSEIHGLTTVALRYFNVFGPSQDPNSQYSAVIPLFVKGLIQDKPPTINGDGEQSRDFTYISNVIQANLKACEADVSGFNVFNVACGGRFTLNHLYNTLAAEIGSSVRPSYGPDRAGDVKHSMADITAISKALGYKPTVSFEEGIAKTVAWYKAAGPEALG
jgi:UDP-N-acetylglucosamine/UDP-N-acetylgalactosamine 4-epimerase